jgi:hypothetical protein
MVVRLLKPAYAYLDSEDGIILVDRTDAYVEVRRGNRGRRVCSTPYPHVLVLSPEGVVHWTPSHDFEVGP